MNIYYLPQDHRSSSEAAVSSRRLHTAIPCFQRLLNINISQPLLPDPSSQSTYTSCYIERRALKAEVITITPLIPVSTGNKAEYRPVICCFRRGERWTFDV